MSCTGYIRFPFEELILLAFLPRANSPSSDWLSVTPRICLHGHEKTEQNWSIRFGLESCTITAVSCFVYEALCKAFLLHYLPTIYLCSQPLPVSKIMQVLSCFPLALLNDIAELQKQAGLFKTPNNPWCPMFFLDRWTIIIFWLF